MKKLSFLVSFATLLAGLSASAGTSLSYKCSAIPGMVGRMDTNSYTVVRDRSSNGLERITLLINGKPSAPLTIAPSLPGQMKYTCDEAEVTIPSSESSVISIKSKISSYSADCVKQ